MDIINQKVILVLILNQDYMGFTAFLMFLGDIFDGLTEEKALECKNEVESNKLQLISFCIIRLREN